MGKMIDILEFLFPGYTVPEEFTRGTWRLVLIKRLLFQFPKKEIKSHKLKS